MKVCVVAVLVVVAAACLAQAEILSHAEPQQPRQAAEKAEGTHQVLKERKQQTVDQKGQHNTDNNEPGTQRILEEKQQQTKEKKEQMTTDQKTQGKEEEKQEAQQPQQTREKKKQQMKEEQTPDQKQTRKEKPHQGEERKASEKEEITENRQQTKQRQATEDKLPQTEDKKQQKAKYRVLFLYPFAPRSHASFYGGIINALADAGHHVTVVAPHESFEARDEVRTVLVKEGDVTSSVKDAFDEHRLQVAINAAFVAVELCSNLLASPQVQDLMKEKFDVAILSLAFSDCFLSLVHRMKVPFIWASPIGMVGMVSAYIGSPQFPSFIGTKLTNLRHPLSFPERAFATITETLFSVLHTRLVVASMETECRQRGLCPPDMPSLQDMKRNASLVLLNSVKALEIPARPSTGEELHLGGIHCRPAKPLSPELEAWVQGAGEAGFIFFSLGSIIKPSTMPEQTRVALLEAFAYLDQRVLWKWDEDTMPGLPSNVRLAKWLPQQDILGHPRLRLFITHGGLMSTTEASYHGVPVLGLPIFTDQFTNMQEAQAEGWGRYLSWDNLTRHSVQEAILSLMTDESLRAKAKQRGVIMRDQPMTPAETVVFWVEYVVRHRGAKHLHCPSVDMPWYKLYNVDVWVTVAVVVVLVIYVSMRLTAALFFCLCRSCAGKTKKD